MTKCVLNMLSTSGRAASIEFEEGEPITMSVMTLKDDSVVLPPNPSTPIEPPPAQPPKNWWPTPDKPSIAVRTAQELVEALPKLKVAGGFLLLMTMVASDAFCDQLRYNGLSGKPDSNIVVQVEKDVCLRKPIRNVKGQLKHLCFDNIVFKPDSFGGICFRLHGSHSDLHWLNPKFENWNQVLEAKHTTQGNDQPVRFEFRGGWAKNIFNQHAPVQTPDNYKDKDHRTQGFWWQGQDFVFEDMLFQGIGWDMKGDPNRTKTGQYDQILYMGQSSKGVKITNCEFAGASNNGVVAKGEDIEIEGCSFTQVVNAIALGTNESPEFVTSARINNCTIGELIPLNHLDNPSLPDNEQIPANSGVVFSLINCDNVKISQIKCGKSFGRRNVFAWFGNNQSRDMEMMNIVFEDCDIKDFELAEMRDYRRPMNGMSVQFNGIKNGSRNSMFVATNSVIPSDFGLATEGISLAGEKIPVATP